MKCDETAYDCKLRFQKLATDSPNRFRSIEEASGYLGGMIAGEGHVHVDRRRKNVYGHIAITNTEAPIIVACIHAYQWLGVDNWYITPKSPNGNRVKCYTLGIARIGDIRSIRDLTLGCPRKEDAIQEIADSDAKEIAPKTPKTPELVSAAVALRNDGLSFRAIAERLGISRSSATKWVRRAQAA